MLVDGDDDRRAERGIPADESDEIGPRAWGLGPNELTGRYSARVASRRRSGSLGPRPWALGPQTTILINRPATKITFFGVPVTQLPG